MAEHATKQLLDAITTTLIAASTDAGDRVFAFRTHPYAPVELPAIELDAPTEAISADQVHHPRTLRRDIAVTITIITQADIAGDASAYTMTAQVEHALATNPPAAGKARAMILENIGREKDVSAERPIIRVTLAYVATVFTVSNAVDTPL